MAWRLLAITTMREYESPKFVVYNLTRESFLSFGVTAVDITLEPPKAIFQRLRSQVVTELWFTTYRGIPAMQERSPVDLVYLSENYRVTQTVESVLSVFVEPLIPLAASVLVLPTHAIYKSRTGTADRLMICGAEEMGHRSEHPSSSNAPSGQSTDSPPKVARSMGGPASPTSADPFSQTRGTSQQLKYKDEAETQTGKKDSFLTRFFRWLDTDRRRTRRYQLRQYVIALLNKSAGSK